MLDQFTDEEKTEIRVAMDHLERMNNQEASEVFEVIELCMTVIEDQGIKIEELQEKLDEKERYIEDWGMY